MTTTKYTCDACKSECNLDNIGKLMLFDVDSSRFGMNQGIATKPYGDFCLECMARLELCIRRLLAQGKNVDKKFSGVKCLPKPNKK